VPDFTIAFFQKSRAGTGQSHSPVIKSPAIIFQRVMIFPASKMPICGHAVVKRAKWLALTTQQALLLVESIQQQKLNTAGSYYRFFPQTARRQEAISLACH